MKSLWTEDRFRTNFKLPTSNFRESTFFEVSFEIIDFQAWKSRFSWRLIFPSYFFKQHEPTEMLTKCQQMLTFLKSTKKTIQNELFLKRFRKLNFSLHFEFNIDLMNEAEFFICGFRPIRPSRFSRQLNGKTFSNFFGAFTQF